MLPHSEPSLNHGHGHGHGQGIMAMTMTMTMVALYIGQYQALLINMKTTTNAIYTRVEARQGGPT